jgi:hypothetical protein
MTSGRCCAQRRQDAQEAGAESRHFSWWRARRSDKARSFWRDIGLVDLGERCIAQVLQQRAEVSFARRH